MVFCFRFMTDLSLWKKGLCIAFTACTLTACTVDIKDNPDHTSTVTSVTGFFDPKVTQLETECKQGKQESCETLQKNREAQSKKNQDIIEMSSGGNYKNRSYINELRPTAP